MNDLTDTIARVAESDASTIGALGALIAAAAVLVRAVGYALERRADAALRREETSSSLVTSLLERVTRLEQRVTVVEAENRQLRGHRDSLIDENEALRDAIAGHRPPPPRVRLDDTGRQSLTQQLIAERR